MAPIFKGSFSGNDHWEWVRYGTGKQHYRKWFGLGPIVEKKVKLEAYIDTSFQDENGYFRLYRVQHSNFSLLVSSGCVFAAVPYALVTIAYHTARIGVVTLYLLGCMFYDGARKKSLSLASKRFCQIFDQAWLSFSTILRTPPCMLGFMFGHFANIALDPLRKTFGDGLNARKFAAACEEFWNRGIPIQHSLQLMPWTYKKRHYQFEGGGDPDRLGTSGYYLAPCQQPIGRAKLNEKNGTIEVITPGNQTSPYTLTDPGKFDIGKRLCCTCL